MAGSYPLGGLVLAASGKLYGVTATGGAFDAGVIFEYDPATNIYTKNLTLIIPTPTAIYRAMA